MRRKVIGYMVALFEEGRKEAFEEVLCDLLLAAIGDLKGVGASERDQWDGQNQGKTFGSKGLHLCAPIIAGAGSATPGEYKATVPASGACHTAGVAEGAC